MNGLIGIINLIINFIYVIICHRFFEQVFFVVQSATDSFPVIQNGRAKNDCYSTSLLLYCTVFGIAKNGQLLNAHCYIILHVHAYLSRTVLSFDMS